MLKSLLARFSRKKAPTLAESYSHQSPLDLLQSLHAKAVATDDKDLLLATTTAFGIFRGMGQMASRSGQEHRDMLESMAAVVYAAGGEVVVQPYHAIQVPQLVLYREQMLDGGIRFMSGVRQ